MNKARLLHLLQNVDLELEQKSERLAEVEASLGKSGKLLAARDALERSEKTLGSHRIRQRDLELEVEALDAKISSTEQRLYSGRVRNPKELASMQKEVRSLKRRRGQLEDKMLEEMIAIEESEAMVSEARQHLDQVETAWREEQDQYSAEHEDLLTHLASLREQRSEREGAVETADLQLYESLRQRKGGRAVAILQQGTCLVCGVAIPTSQAQQVRRGDELSFCPSCGRILCAER